MKVQKACAVPLRRHGPCGQQHTNTHKSQQLHTHIYTCKCTTTQFFSYFQSVTMSAKLQYVRIGVIRKYLDLQTFLRVSKSVPTITDDGNLYFFISSRFHLQSGRRLLRLFGNKFHAVSIVTNQILV